MIEDRTTERLDQVINRLGELSGEVRAMQVRMAQMEHGIERLAIGHVAPSTPHYWAIIISFIVVAAFTAVAIFYAGIMR